MANHIGEQMLNCHSLIAHTTLLMMLFVFNGCHAQDSNSSIASTLKNLESKEADDRITALYDLGWLLTDDPKPADLKNAIPKIVKAIQDRDDVTNSTARIVLKQIGDPAVKYFKTNLESKDDLEYVTGCSAIKSIGKPAASWLPTLTKNLESYQNKDTDLRRLVWTLEAINGLEDEAAPLVDEVAKLIDHKNIKVPVLVCKIISNNGAVSKSHGPTLAAKLEKGPPSVRSWAATALGAIGKHEDYDVLELLSKKLDAFLLIEKQRALEGMAFLGEDAKTKLPEIEKLMRDKSKSAMCSAAYAHWRVTGNSDKAIETLKSLLHSRSFADEAIQTIGRFGAEAKSLVPDLKIQLNSIEPVRRENAIWALGDIGKDAAPAIEQLKKISKSDKDAGIRGLAKIRIQMIEEAKE